MYSAVTGESVGSLVGHTAEVTGVVLNPENADQVYTWSMDASVRLWDYRAGEELSRVSTGEPVKYMVVHRELGVAYLSIQLRSGGGRVLLYNLKTRKFSGTAMKTRSAGPLVLSPAGTLAATIDKHSLFVWRTGADVYQPLNLHHTKPYTCLAISPDDSLIAAGDMTGRMLIWRSFEHSVPSALRDRRDHAGKAHPALQPPLTTLHWHASAVGALTFSPDGTYLVSGGNEGALVFWALENNQPTFMPRLGGPIIGLHPSPADPAKYVVRQADNVVRIINAASRTVEASVLGLRPPPSGLLPPAGVAGGAAALLPAGAAAGGGGGGGGGVLVVPCENAQLQFYDVARDRHLQLLQVVPRNAVSHAGLLPAASGSGTGGGRGGGAAAAAHLEAPPPPFVSLVAFSADCSVMATVDVRPDGGPYGSSEACLKFWDSTSGRALADSQSAAEPDLPSTSAPGGPEAFRLSTRVDEPHRDLVSSLTYHPRRHVAVTTGGSESDSEFKVWIRERRPGSGPNAAGGGVAAAAAATSSWRCLSTGGFKGLTLGATAFSSDGSVLAVSAAAKVTLWDAETNALAAVLPPASASAAAPAGPAGSQPMAPPAVTQLAFIPGTPFLAAASPACVAVYNLLTAAVHWCLPYGATSISADAAHGLLAAALPAPRPAKALPPAALDGEAADGEPSQPTLQTADNSRPDEQRQAQQQQHPGSAPSQAPLQGTSPHQHQMRPRQPAAEPSCHVVVFDPRDGTPRYHCHVPGAAHVYVAHLRQAAGGSGAAAAGPSGTGTEGSSPLLIVRDNRQYSLVTLPGTEDRVAAEPLLRAPLEREQLASALEAAFGRAAPTGAAAAPMDVDGKAATAVGGRQRWAELFDAPSHVLPPPTALATAFLTLLTTDA